MRILKWCIGLENWLSAEPSTGDTNNQKILLCSGYTYFWGSDMIGYLEVTRIMLPGSPLQGQF